MGAEHLERSSDPVGQHDRRRCRDEQGQAERDETAMEQLPKLCEHSPGFHIHPDQGHNPSLAVFDGGKGAQPGAERILREGVIDTGFLQPGAFRGFAEFHGVPDMRFFGTFLGGIDHVFPTLSS